jgi:ADP-heptose:LPS heptosyltransferase
MTRQALIVNITRMGDLVQMGALLARLRDEWPDVAIDLIVDHRFAPVASMLTGLRHVIGFDFHELIEVSRAGVKDAVALFEELAAWARPLHERRYDRIINLTFNQPSALLTGYVDAPDIRGAHSAWDGGTVIVNPWMAYFTDIHRFRRFNRFNLVDVYAMGGSRPGPYAPLQLAIPGEAKDWARRYLASSEPAARQWIAVQAGASDGMKAWHPHSFGQTLAELSARWHGGIVLIGSPSEEHTIAEVIQAYRAAGGQNPIKNAAGQTTLSQLAALLGECRLLLTNDTGPMHLAVAAGTPVIDLSVGHVDFRETGPYGPGHWVIQPELDCAPCGFEQVCAHHACKDRIRSSCVAQLMLHILGSAPCPTTFSGGRLYESGIDEDRLGTFRLRAGVEHPIESWYATFWRRYWYETFSGTPSRVPLTPASPPDADEAASHLAALLPLLDGLCRRGDEIARLAAVPGGRAASLRALQDEQRKEREHVTQIAMTRPITAPLTATFLRVLYSDNVQGLDRLARHHAQAYRQWRDRTAEIYRTLFGKSETLPLTRRPTTRAPLPVVTG